MICFTHPFTMIFVVLYPFIFIVRATLSYCLCFILLYCYNKTPLEGLDAQATTSFSGYSSIQFLIHFPFHNTCVTYRAPSSVIAHKVLLTQHLPRNARDFLRGGKCRKHVPLSTYLLATKRYYLVELKVVLISYVLGSVMEHYVNLLLMLSTLFNNSCMS